ncbi:MAG: cytochrome b/b6 domain-containing protein [Pseudomonadota bacterium]
MNDSPAARSIRVWDAPVRVFHWLMVASFAGAWLTAESERWRLVHVSLGYTMAGLVVFRLLWGLVGTRHAQFGDFVRGPRAVLRYLRSLLSGRPEHHVGHNPAGGWAILALLGLAALTTAFGWATYNEIGGEWLEEAHEAAATLMLLVVGLHVAGVAVGSLVHRENLVRAMVTGRKQGDPGQDNGSPWRAMAVLLLAAVLGFWALQWQQAPAGNSADAQRTAAADRHDDDDD